MSIADSVRRTHRRTSSAISSYATRNRGITVKCFQGFVPEMFRRKNDAYMQYHLIYLKLEFPNGFELPNEPFSAPIKFI